MTLDYPILQLQPGREYALLQGHPWLFSGAFRHLPRELPAGSVVDVTASGGEWVGRGYINAANSLAFRLLTRNREEAIDERFYVQRVEQALALRKLLPVAVNAYRLLHAEADALPGVIVDRYDRWLVVQLHTAGAERDREAILAALQQVTQAEGILVRNDVRVRAREGLTVGGAELALGTVPEHIEISEGDVRYLVDPYGGQKTGFFLDQREKRARIAAFAPHFGSLLNCFSYSGGFALAGLASNPHLRTVNVDSSAPALELARRNYTFNGHDPAAHSFEERDVIPYLQRAIAAGERFDLVILDPPAYAKSIAMKERALRGYETLNHLGAQAVAPGGLLLTCSCSGGVNYAEFEGAVRSGLRHAERMGQILDIFGPSLDHPTLPGFVEDRYLKALLLRVE